MRVHDILRYLKSAPLNPSKTYTVRLSNQHDITWTEFGQTDLSKVKHIILYFHGSPMCRYEPMLHSILPSNPFIQQHDQPNHQSTSTTTFIDSYKEHNIRLCCFERPGFGMTPYRSNRSVIEFANDEVLDMKEMQLSSSSSLSSPSSSSSSSSSLSSSSQDRIKVSVMGYSAGGPYALAFHRLFPSKIHSTAIIASSVSAAIDKQYFYSWRGQIEHSFFSLPIIFQSILYNISIHTFLFIINSFIVSSPILSYYPYTYHILSGMNEKEIKTMILKLKTIKDVINESIRVNGVKGLVMDTLVTQSIKFPWGIDFNNDNNNDSGSSNYSGNSNIGFSNTNNNNNNNCNTNNNNNNNNNNNGYHDNTVNITTITNTTTTIINNNVIDDGVSDGIQSTEENRVIQQLSPQQQQQQSHQQQLSHQQQSLLQQQQSLQQQQQKQSHQPPLYLYYSKDDTTVPWTAGVRLTECLKQYHSLQHQQHHPPPDQNQAVQLIWLSGGHACFFLHLNQIIKDIIR